jgi:hypothetical protein
MTQSIGLTSSFTFATGLLGTQTNLTSNLILSTQSNVLTVNAPNNEKLLEITNDGDVFFRLSEWKKIECENDISLMFVAVISGLSGVQCKDKNELISKIIKNYRGNQIDKILS